MYSSTVILLIFFSLLQIGVLNHDNYMVNAIRILSSSSSSKDSDKIYKKFFNGRLGQMMNTTNVSKGKDVQENKRRIPSCPDALHN